MWALVLFAATIQELPEVLIDRDNVRITASCRVRIAGNIIRDLDNNGVLQIEGDGIVVDFGGQRLRGSASSIDPDQMAGTGVVVRGNDIALRNARISGFKVGVHANEADRLSIEGCSFDDNYRQRLLSTPEREDVRDWLRPHHNDQNEWLELYGAAVCIEDSSDVTVSNTQVRRGQNGIILDRVRRARVFDNDCSFLSGWGLAMWRTSECVISRNAFDFCIRGYSHGVYSRGQDSAGILMFEQCTNNVIAANSATHGGDGVFAFSGMEAIGESGPAHEAHWYESRGSVGNVFIGNDFSFAAAHGLESTFGFDTIIIGNRFTENAHCGVWAGYSNRSLIADNQFIGNGGVPHGLERGGVNIEHGSDNRILENEFRENACGVHLWWDNDERLLSMPWARVNGAAASNNIVAGNTFEGDTVALQLRATEATIIAPNTFRRVGQRIMQDDARPTRTRASRPVMQYARPEFELPGESEPIGARAAVAGRHRIIMTEWGPHDWMTPRYVSLPPTTDEHGNPRIVYQYLPAFLADGYQPPFTSYNYDPDHVAADWTRLSEEESSKKSIQFTALTPGVHPITFKWGMSRNRTHDLSRLLVATQWSVRHFRSRVDPREDYDRWRRLGERVQPTKTTSLTFAWGSGGPSERIGTDRFGTIATTTVPMPSGHWRLSTRSDDGIRVWVDDGLAIDDWTHHAPTPHTYDFELTEARGVTIRVEHFELDGHAELSLVIEPGGHQLR